MRYMLILLCGLAIGGQTTDFKKAKEEYTRELGKLEDEHRRRVELLKIKYHKISERKEVAATRAGNTEAALVWKGWSEEIEPEYRNLTAEADIELSGTFRVVTDPRTALFDGVPEDPNELRPYWFPGDDHIQYVNFEWKRPRKIRKIYFTIPHGTSFSGYGHEPLDYDIFINYKNKLVQAIEVKDGKHPGGGGEMIWNGKGKTVTWKFDPVIATMVTFDCSRTSGKNHGPILFEFAIRGE